MPKILVGFILVFSLTFICICSEADEIYSPSKSILSFDNYLIIQGRWKTTTKTKYPRLPRINSTYITCDKQSMTCIENIAVLWTPEDEPKLKQTSLQVLNINYRIINWSDDTINAKYEALVADLEIRISLRDKFAERSFRETKARGSETADPNIYVHWILE